MFRTIDINSGISDTDGRENAIKSLVFQTFLETILQLYSFIVNPALRLYSAFSFIEVLKQNLLLDYSAGKKSRPFLVGFVIMKSSCGYRVRKKVKETGLFL